ncbi:MAG: hypothetical protein IT379_05315 [Deltaproteobacteria bacterium]|nr:hypothetical protein [Deltaproteobacteria bacterium]
MSGPVEIHARAEPMSREKSVPPAFRALAARFGIHDPCERIHFRVRNAELTVSFSWSTGKHGTSVSGFAITRSVSPRPAIILRREGSADQDGKSMGLNRELQTGDPTFDGHVYVESRASERAMAETLASPGLRQAVVELLALGATNVTVGPKSIDAQFSRPIGGTAEFEPDVILATLEPFARLLESLPKATLEIPRDADGKTSTLGCILVVGVAAGLPIASIVAYILSWTLRDVTGLVGYQPFILGAGCGLVLSVIGTMLSYLSVRIRPTSTGFRTFVGRTVLSFLVCLPGGTPLLLMVDRATITQSPARVVETTIVDYSVSEGEWELDVASWDRPGETEVFEVGDYPGVSTGGRLRLTVSRGILGFQWVRSYVSLGN